ncbi:Pycsar system effector family protein [Occultella kanbiaonis]|uniref:Pycsar system effector family protein n=1 Tax=Occultella kanbiaonis TaxID=2675754 RepID=UPI0039A744F3
MLAEARAEVGTADAKASILLAALGVGFGALIAGLLAGDWEPADLEGLAEALWWIGAGFATASIVCAALAVWPRYVRSDASNGVHYWGHAATYKRLEDLACVLDSSSHEDGRQRTRHQLWALSKIVSRKYTFVRSAIVTAGVASAALFISVQI